MPSTNFSLSLPGGLTNTLGGPADEYYLLRLSATAYRPYADAAEAVASVPAAARAYRTVNVAGVEQWWTTDLSDGGLHVKTVASTGSGGTAALDSLATPSATAPPTVNAVVGGLAGKADLVNGKVPAAQLPPPAGEVVYYDGSPATGTVRFHLDPSAFPAGTRFYYAFDPAPAGPPPAGATAFGAPFPLVLSSPTGATALGMPFPLVLTS